MSRLGTVAKHLSLLLAVASIVGCDRVTKSVAVETLSRTPAKSYFFDVFRLTYAENPGSFLSLGADLPGTLRFALFVIAAGVMLVALSVYAIRTRSSGVKRVGLALVVAGGASNWVDRLADGRVVDFLNVGVGPIRTGIFNVADVALMAGLALLIASELRRRGRAGTRA